MAENEFLRISPGEEAGLARRMGAASFAERLRKENARELAFGGRLRWCPMKWAGPAARLAFRCAGLYGRARREFLDVRVREETFALPGLAPELAGFTLLHLSDLHLDIDPALPDAIRGALATVSGRYDAAAATGDFNNFTVHGDTKALDLAASLRGAFTAPVFAVLGNHDSVRDVPYLERAGYRVLLNESVRLRRAGADLGSVRAQAGEEADRGEQDRLARAGLAGDGDEAGAERDVGLLDDREAAHGKGFDHGGGTGAGAEGAPTSARSRSGRRRGRSPPRPSGRRSSRRCRPRPSRGGSPAPRRAARCCRA